MSLENVEGVFDHLYRAYHEEYVLYNLGAAALAAALPRLTQRLQGWAPLAAPAQGALEFRRWRALLDPGSAGGGGGGGGASLFAGAGAVPGAGTDGVAQDPYLALVTELVLPPLRWVVILCCSCNIPKPRKSSQSPALTLGFLVMYDCLGARTCQGWAGMPEAGHLHRPVLHQQYGITVAVPQV
jgi:hypothetical protein